MHSRKSNFILLVIILLPFSKLNAQSHFRETENKNGRIYFLWGYNKDWFSRSDIHFSSKTNNDFDFTLYNVKAHDKPRLNKFFNKDLSIPQFVYRLGYNFPSDSHWGIELSFDHAKYILTQNQVVRVKGKIFENYVDKDTTVTSNFVRFEHTNGANFLMLSAVYKSIIYRSPSGSNEFYGTIKPGAGIAIPQSEVALFNVNQNNNYHIAGYISGVDLSVRYEFRKHFLAETGFKGLYANFIDVLSVGDSQANHDFFCLEWIFSFGYQIAL